VGGEKEDHGQEKEEGAGCGPKRVRENTHFKPLGAKKGEGRRNESEKPGNGETMKNGNKKAQGTRCKGQGQEIKNP
jgi:hypothetical protein